jgi:hypothetical protein
MADALPRCKFAVRYPAGDGKWRYQSVIVAGYDSSAFAPMRYPPAPGDLISLWDQFRGRLEGGPVFQVVARMWMHSSYGSADWPYGKPEPQSGPLLDIIVEPAEGAYRDETPICGESTCEAVWVNGAWWMPPGADEPDPHEHRPYESAGSHGDGRS